MGKLGTFLAIVVVLVVASAAFYVLTSGVGTFGRDPNRDSDGDGVPDSQDAFDNDPTETSDWDGDGVGDNKDEFPHDSKEWKDSDDDGIGDNADFYDAGNGAVKVWVTYFVMTSGPNCGSNDPCDIWFGFTVDVDGNSPWDCVKGGGQNPVIHTDQGDKWMQDPEGAFIVCDIPDGTASIKVTIGANDQDPNNYLTPIDFTPETGPPEYLVTVLSPFAETHSLSGDSGASYRARLDWKIAGMAA